MDSSWGASVVFIRAGGLLALHHGEMHVTETEPRAFGNGAKQPVAGLQPAGIQQLLHDQVDRDRADVADAREVAEPAIGGNPEALLHHAVVQARAEILR